MAGCYRSSKQRGRCAQSGEWGRILWLVFWGGVWCWFCARTLRTARLLCACQQLGSACLRAAGHGTCAQRLQVYNKTLGDWRTHNGVDYACAQDAAVSAPVNGKVTAVETDGRWGGVVSIEDGEGRVWRVCGTADVQVKAGDTVSTGQTLGRAGNIPNECTEETHVHLEVLEGDKYLDPAKLIG